MTFTKEQYKAIKKRENDKIKEIVISVLKEIKPQTYGEKINTYGDSYTSPKEHQNNRDTFFMDRDMLVLHNDLKKIIELLEKK